MQRLHTLIFLALIAGVVSQSYARAATADSQVSIENFTFEPADITVPAGTTVACRMVVVPLFQDRMSDRKHATRNFCEHVAAVRAEIEPARLLVFDVREGWAPLCAFLGVPVPDLPFPWTNASQTFSDRAWWPA